MSLNFNWFQNGQPSKLEEKKSSFLCPFFISLLKWGKFWITKWGTLCIWTPTGSKMASRQSWKNERKSPSRYGNRLKTDILSYFQLWHLAILEPVGVQIRNVPHFKGLIVLYLDLRISRAWQYIYPPPRPLEKGHFTPKTAKCPRIGVPKCM